MTQAPVPSPEPDVQAPAGVASDGFGQLGRETRLRILADAAAIVAASEDYESALHHLAELVVPTMADWCAIDVIEPNGMRRVAVAQPDRSSRMSGMATQIHRLPRRTDPGMSEALRTGQPQIVEITEEILAAVARSKRHLAQIRRLDLRSAAILPLMARGQRLGVVTIARSANRRPFTERDIPFLGDLALRAGIALDNLRLLNEAQEAIRLRDDFMAMASHDMRTPLGAILGNIELAMRKLPRVQGEVRDDLERTLSRAIRTTARMVRLVEELMDVSMMRTGQALPLKLQDVDVVELLSEVVAEHQRMTEMHTLTVEGIGELVGNYDGTRLERVLDNLVGNAVKYSPDGGTIVTRVERDDTTAVISVTDPGIGIPDDELQLVFDPYHRGSNAAGLKGIGLGLAGAREVVRQLGGDIVAESVLGKGSTFTVRLPLS